MILHDTIAVNECKDGCLYTTASRNLKFGIFKKGYFVGIREKFGHVYLDIEVHRGIPGGSACPKKYLEQSPFSHDQIDITNEQLFNWLTEKEREYSGTF